VITSPLLGWYGKLPSSGDFVGRGLSRETTQRLDEWFQSGLVQFRHRSPDWQYFFANSTPWACVLPAGLVTSQAVKGYLCASADRVGRLFPLMVLRELGDVESAVSATSVWHEGTAQLLTRAVREQLPPDAVHQGLSASAGGSTPVSGIISAGTVTHAMSASSGSDILDVLNSGTATHAGPFQAKVPQPDARPATLPNESAAAFDPRGTQSLWWTHPVASGAAFTPFAHRGPLSSGLFIVLFAGI
jgi:type VI secretion system protein ImpM